MVADRLSQFYIRLLFIKPLLIVCHHKPEISFTIRLSIITIYRVDIGNGIFNNKVSRFELPTHYRFVKSDFEVSLMLQLRTNSSIRSQSGIRMRIPEHDPSKWLFP